MPLPLKFYRRDTETVARELLGCTLVRLVRGRRLAGRIIETEAYLGVHDRACHTFGGRRTERVRSMYLAGGHAYVYLIYGMHYCFNVVTRAAGEPEAVLIRALLPVDGVETMRRLRGLRSDRGLTDGPGKLCQALAVDRSCDGLSLLGTDLYIEAGCLDANEKILTSPRIGIDSAGDAASWPLRFYVAECP